MTDAMLWSIIFTVALLAGVLVGHYIARDWGKR
jgi:uncharacterized protein YneF (UPF0154 family)